MSKDTVKISKAKAFPAQHIESFTAGVAGMVPTPPSPLAGEGRAEIFNYIEFY